jgi:hypothetical protein
MVLAGLLVTFASGCGRDGGGGPSAITAAASPAAPTQPSSTVPATSSTGVSLRLSDGTSVVAVDPATGATRVRWPEAALSLEGTWTVAVAKVGSSTVASWVDASGVVDHAGPSPTALHPA